MMYVFYAAQCVGAVAAMHHSLQRVLTLSVMAVIVLVRLPFTVIIYIYTRQSRADLCGMKDNPKRSMWCDTEPVFTHDWQVVVLYSFYLVVGGTCFCQCFSAATQLVQGVAARAVAATVMNVMYYAGIGLASCMILGFQPDFDMS